MTKKEKFRIAAQCGYDYSYSGNAKKGFLTKIEGIHNINPPDDATSIKFKKLMSESILQD